MTTTNIAVLLDDSAARAPERAALIAPGVGAVSFRELADRTARVAGGLAAHGLRPANAALLYLPMSVELYTTLLAVCRAGALAVFLDPWLTRRQCEAAIAATNPLMFIAVTRAHLLRLRSRAMRTIPVKVTAGRRVGPLPAPHTFNELTNHTAVPVAAVAPETTALVTFTSGSSGAPRGANRTHDYLLAQHAVLRDCFPYRDDDIDMTMFPVFALNNLARCITTVIPAMDFRAVATVNADTIVAQMLHHRVTTCTASPVFIDRLVARLARQPEPTLHLRRILTGGAPVSDNQLREWRRVLPACEIVVLYGSTEAEPIAHISADERLAVSAPAARAFPGYCCGRPIAKLRTALVRATTDQLPAPGRAWRDELLPPGSEGELLVAGEHVCRDYYRDPAATQLGKVCDGDTVWHRTGDCGHFDAVGNFWLTGRTHAIIRRAGTILFPYPYELAAMTLVTGARRAAALGRPDPAHGELLALIIEAGGTPDLQPLRTALMAAGLPIDELLVRAQPLPLDPRHNGKVDYARLRRDFGR